MKIERTKSAKEGITWGVFAKFVGLLFPFFVRTVLIKTIGIEYVGLNGLFTSVLELLNLTELGIGTAIVYSMYKPIAEDDEYTICALMNLYKKLYRFIGFLVLIIGLLLLPFVNRFVTGDIPDGINLHILYLIYLSSSVITYWLFAYKTCLLNAHQRSDIINKTNLILTSILYSLQIIVLICLKNYYTFVILNPLIGIIINIVNAYYANKLFPRYKCSGFISKELITDIKKRISGLLLSKIAYKVRYSLGNILVSAYLGLQIMAIYNNYYYVMSAIAGIFSVVSTSITAGIGNSIVVDTKQKNETDMNILTFLYLTLSFICFCCLLSLYQPFMYLWVGEENMFPITIMISFSTFFIVDKLLSIIGIYYDAAGLWWEGKLKGVIEAILHIIMTILFTKYFGVIGTLYAAIISVLLIGFPLTSFYMYKYYYGKSSLHYVMSFISIVMLMFVIGVIPYILSHYLLVCKKIENNIFLQLSVVIINISISLLLYFLVFRNTEIFRQSVQWVKGHLK